MSSRRRKNRKTAAKVVFAVIIAILSVVLVAGGAAYWYVSDLVSRMDHSESVDPSKISLSENENLTGYRNIALFGVDSREKGSRSRSDCMIIASIDNKTHDVKLVSVYRDSYLMVSGYGLTKANNAYSWGGAELALKTLNENLDLNLTEFVTVNFDSMSEAVDALGGIDMEITEAELQYINQYVDDTNLWTGKKSQHIETAGPHHLDGVQAVAYCRIRYTRGGDYKRTERMRNVIQAMVKVIKTKSFSEMDAFAKLILPKVYTNLSANDIFSLLPAFASFNITESIGWPYDIEGVTLERWYGVPVTLQSNVERLHREIFNDPDYKAPDSVVSISNQIIDKTGRINEEK